MRTGVQCVSCSEIVAPVSRWICVQNSPLFMTERARCSLHQWWRMQQVCAVKWGLRHLCVCAFVSLHRSFTLYRLSACLRFDDGKPKAMSFAVATADVMDTAMAGSRHRAKSQSQTFTWSSHLIIQTYNRTYKRQASQFKATSSRQY